MANRKEANRKDQSASISKLKGVDQRVAKNPAAVALGKLGGKKGGPARAAKLSAEERSAIAKRAAQARWNKHKQQ